MSSILTYGMDSITGQARYFNNSSDVIVGSVGILSTTTGIDGTAATTTNLYTVPSGFTAIIVGAVIRLTALTSLITVATAGIGVASGESDIFPAIVLTGLSSTTKAFMMSNNLLAFTPAVANDVIKLGIDVGYVAATATLSVDLLGYLL